MALVSESVDRLRAQQNASRAWAVGGCGNCDGSGKRSALVRFARPTRCEWVDMPCIDCDGTGTMTIERVAALTAGEAMRQDRISRGLSLRQEAVRLGIPDRDLSDREMGRS